jgi:tetratricopeptide (TPR) repeat protein
MEFYPRHYRHPLRFKLFFRGLVALISVGALSVALCLPSALAEWRLQIPVDEYRSIEGGMVELRVGSIQRIVPESAATEFVIDRYLELRLLDERVKPELVERYLINNREDLTAAEFGKLLALLLRQSTYKGENFSEIQATVQMRSDVVDVLKPLFASYSGAVPIRKEIHELLFILLQSEMEWVRGSLGTNAQGDRFREFLLEKYRTLAKQGDFQAASAVVEMVGKLFGEQSHSHRALVGLSGRVTGSRQLLEQDTVQDLILLMRRVREDREVGDLLDELTLRRVHSKAEKLLESGETSSALTLLAEVAAGERTPTTLRLLKRAAMELQVLEGESPLFASNNFAVVRELSEGSYSVREKVLNYLQLQSEEYIAQRSFDHALEAFDLVQELRPDPHRDNDRFRFALGIAYLENGRRGAAVEIFEQRNSSFSPVELWQLSNAGYYSQRLLGSLFLLTALLGVLILIVLRTRLQRRKRAAAALDDEETEAGYEESQMSETRRSRGFERIALKQGLDPRIQEYRLLLHRLGVGPEADMNVIKATYRQKLKKLHPDLQDNDGTGDREEFYRLKETYEKILQLRELLELSPDGPAE